MNIAPDAVVQIHYTLKDDEGEVIDSSEGREPLTYLHGRGNLIPGLERELEGKKAGDRLNVTIAPADGYGEYNEELTQEIPRSALPDAADLQEGMQVHARSDQGMVTLTVIEVGEDTITLDANHPLAGKTLHFDVEIADVRDATGEELEHGHVHGPGGHHHH